MTTPARPRVMIGLPCAAHVHGDNPRGIVDMARRAEDAGVDGVVIPDHVVMGNHTENYSWGPFPFPPDAPWLEALTILTAVATVTDRLRLATGILIVPLRPAALLAKTLATIDVLSGGRVELGAGTGWQEEEFLAEGLDFAKRGQLMTDTIAACRALWAPGQASFKSESISFEDIWCEPKPVQPGGIPVLFSGTLTPRTMRRVVELGDGWIPIMGETHEGIATGVERLRAAYRAAGRDPDRLIVRTQLSVRKAADGTRSLEESLAGAADHAEIGVTDVTVPTAAFIRHPDDIPGYFARLGRALARS
ncbi:MAG: putative F420-dependent oxidoreductase [Acidimicrobiales bacterium]|jgi:probable F420-dependent oxidoreductase|nr:putative F420-dependent oxidoreductase [Acidimicrobiales bacterium]